MRRTPVSVIVLLTSWAVMLQAQGQFPNQGQARPGEQAAPAPRGPGQLPPRDPQQSQPATGTGVIRGRVVAAESGQALRGTRITVFAPEIQETRGALTDEDGYYELSELPAGRYTLNANKGGYVGVSYGQRRSFETPRPIDLADGQTLEKIDFSLPRGAVITGHVVDDFGEPVTGAMVQVGRLRYMGGQRRFMNAGQIDQSDDRGQFRIYGLSPGEYFVSARTPPGGAMNISSSSMGYATTYYPGAPSLGEASQVSVGLGQEVSGIVISMVRSRTASVSGVVLASSGKPASSIILMVRQSATEAGGMFMSAGAAVKPDGSFTIASLTPGTYTIDARQTSALVRGETASVDVTVAGEDITGLTLVMSAGGVARGLVRFDGGQPPESLRPGEVRLNAMPATFNLFGPPSQATANDDWTFELTGLTGERLIRTNVPQGWFLKSVVVDGSDVTDTPIDFGANGDADGIEVVLTQQVTSVSGIVKDRKGAALSDYVAVIFAEDSERWGFQTRYVRSGRPDQEGRFTVTGLPPGRYLATAVEYLEAGEESNPDTLEQLRIPATSFTLQDGETRTLDLELSSY